MPQERTTLGPLLESWKYPNRCTELFVSCTTCSEAWQGQKCGDGEMEPEGIVDDIGCWPPTSMELPSNYTSEYQRDQMKPSTTVEVSLPLKGWGIYFPADQCPDGYYEACWGEGPDTGAFDFQFSVYKGERVKGCCPHDYTCGNFEGKQTCTSVTTKGEVQIAWCDGTTMVHSEITLPLGVPSSRSIEAITLYAPMIQAVSGEGDFGQLSTTSSATSTSQDYVGGTVYGDSDSGSGSGLSTGAQAGIGVGVGVVGLGILAAAWLLWRRRRRPKANDEVTYDKPQLDSREVNGPSELGMAPPQSTHGTGELDGTLARQELNGTSARQELNGSAPTRHELP